MLSRGMRPALGYVLRLACALAVAGALVRLIGSPDWGRLLAADWRWLAAGLAVTLLTNLVSTLRWRLALRACDSHASIRLGELYSIGALTNLLGMTGIGGGAAAVAAQPVALAGRAGVSLRAAAASVITDRALDLLVLLPAFGVALACIAGAIELQAGGLLAAIGITCLPVLAATRPGAVATAAALPLRVAARLAGRWARLRRGGGAGPASTAPLARLPAGVARNMALLTVLRFAGLVLRIQCIAWAFGIQIPLPAMVMGLAILQLGLLVALTPGALGVAEWGWAVVLVQAGMSGAEAVFAGIAFRAYVTAYVLATFLIAALARVATSRRPRSGRYGGAPAGPAGPPSTT